MSTIELISSEIIRVGVSRGFAVVPEFSVAGPTLACRKKIDLVWLKARRDDSLSGSLRDWRISVAFEIEGFNVPAQRIASHAKQFSVLQGMNGKSFTCYAVLYSSARHRRNPSWGCAHPEGLISKRRDVARFAGSSMLVVDGREMAWLAEVEAE